MLFDSHVMLMCLNISMYVDSMLMFLMCSRVGICALIEANDFADLCVGYVGRHFYFSKCLNRVYQVHVI